MADDHHTISCLNKISPCREAQPSRLFIRHPEYVYAKRSRTKTYPERMPPQCTSLGSSMMGTQPRPRHASVDPSSTHEWLLVDQLWDYLLESSRRLTLARRRPNHQAQKYNKNFHFITTPIYRLHFQPVPYYSLRLQPRQIECFQRAVDPLSNARLYWS